eukprot:Protomagalhaensia_sp_Gyna_25__2142@NODE_2160_length_1254_cov_5_932510_g1784_i0_p1_GENE_NODE_2160_length_1254_cov_5_932510_g1784_i0NODE_2160_length_1254_cov_5_932510_g1784_i0_p1_ORF_typecomplete_len379_score41_53_NODE_2160_length_1254_cov_5_932510_g1784_i0481184
MMSGSHAAVSKNHSPLRSPTHRKQCNGESPATLAALGRSRSEVHMIPRKTPMSTDVYTDRRRPVCKFSEESLPLRRNEVTYAYARHAGSKDDSHEDLSNRGDYTRQAPADTRNPTVKIQTPAHTRYLVAHHSQTGQCRRPSAPTRQYHGQRRIPQQVEYGDPSLFPDTMDQEGNAFSSVPTEIHERIHLPSSQSMNLTMIPGPQVHSQGMLSQQLISPKTTVLTEIPGTEEEEEAENYDRLLLMDSPPMEANFLEDQLFGSPKSRLSPPRGSPDCKSPIRAHKSVGTGPKTSGTTYTSQNTTPPLWETSPPPTHLPFSLEEISILEETRRILFEGIRVHSRIVAESDCTSPLRRKALDDIQKSLGVIQAFPKYSGLEA